MPFIVINARKTKYNLLGHIGIHFYNKGNVIITNVYKTLYTSYFRNAFCVLFNPYNSIMK